MMIRQVGVHIKVKNIERSLAFYNAFRLRPCFVYGDKRFLNRFEATLPKATENYRGVVFDINGSLLEIADGHMAVKPETFKERIHSSKTSLMLYVSSIDKILKVCKENRFKVIVPVKVFPWGTKELVVKDPDGFVLVFIESVAA